MNRPTLENLVAKTPWWAVATALHVLLAAIAGLFWVVGSWVEESVVAVNPRRNPPPAPDMERPRDLDPNKKILTLEK